MKLKACERCGKRTAEGLTLCPACMKESGAAAEIVEAAEELRDIARVLSITANTDTNIREAMAGILNIADRVRVEVEGAGRGDIPAAVKAAKGRDTEDAE